MTSIDSKPPISLVKLAHSLIKDKVNPGDIVVDATVGNGYDTRFLLELVGRKGTVYGFDIQQASIDSAQSLLQTYLMTHYLTLIHASHAEMLKFISSAYHGKISAVMFNLGYLPGGDKRVITQADSTLAALASASQLLSDSGVITALAYPGHQGGEMETDQVKNWCRSLDPAHFKVDLFESQPYKTSAPQLFAITKTR